MKNFTLENIKKINSQTILVSLVPKSKKDQLDFTAGQYASIGFKKIVRPSPMRCFSIVSSPYEKDKLQFAMRIYGDFTHSISSLKPGTSFFVNGPFGEFFVDKQFDKNIILIAGGIGVTPYISIIKELSQSKDNIPITLLYSNHTQDNIPFYYELMDLMKMNERFNVVFFITNGPIDPSKVGKFIVGRLKIDHLKNLTGLKFNDFTYFICGPSSFSNNLHYLLTSHGTDPINIVTEEFSTTSQIKSASNESTLNLKKLTYGLSTLALVFGTFFIMAIDLVIALPKIIAITSKSSVNQTVQTSNTAPINSTPSANNVLPQSTQNNIQSPITSVS